MADYKRDWFSMYEGVRAPYQQRHRERTMNGKQLVIGIVWLGFAALTAMVFIHDGAAALSLPFDSYTNMTTMIDLLIELALVSIWMYFDARKRGTTAIPFIGMA